MHTGIRPLFVFAIVAALLLSAPSLRAAQGITVTGRVVDENGAPVREAVVTVSAAGTSSVQGRASSDAAGAFRLELPAGGEYRIQAGRDGYFLFSNQSAALDESSPLEIHMNHLKELAESVDVHYSPPVIDPEQTSDTKRVNNAEILNIPYPASQDYRSALSLMTGALLDNSGQLHFNGGYTREANYRLNGFDISDPATGGLAARLNVDAVQTLEWDASRFSPEKGKGSAGTVDIKTEMGDDRWRFGGTNFIPGFGAQDGFHLDHWSPRVKVSGPIRKGRAWFSNSADGYYTLSTVSGLPKGQNRARSASGSNLTRAQWNITNAQIVTASFLGNRADNNRNGLSVLTPVETTLNQRTSLFVGLVKDQWSVGGGLVEFGFADSQGYLRASPQGAGAYVITPFGARGNYFSDQTTYTARQEWLANGFPAPIRRFGAHQIEIGADVERSDLDQSIDRHGFSAVRVDNSVVRDVQFLGSPRQFRHDLAAYGYALDRWTPVANLLIEAGFRTQWDEYTGAELVAPRLAAAWSPARRGEVRGGVGDILRRHHAEPARVESGTD